MKRYLKLTTKTTKNFQKCSNLYLIFFDITLKYRKKIESNSNMQTEQYTVTF